MDLDLRVELRSALKRSPLTAKIVADEVGLWLVIDTPRSIVKYLLPDFMEESILDAIPR